MNTGTHPNAGLAIARMQPADLPEVAAIERDSFSDPWSEAGFASELEEPYALYLSVRFAGEDAVVAYCGMLISADEAEIVNVAVREDCRHAGIGYRMLTRLMELGKERGVLHFTLEVRKNNAPALHLYEKLGFVRVGIRKDFYEKPTEDALILRT